MGTFIFSLEVLLTILVSFSPLIVYFLVSISLQKIAYNNFYSCIGYKGVVATGIIGTTLHELSHYIFCKIFGHRVTDMSFYRPSSVDSTLGYVAFTYKKTSIYQVIGLFWVGYAPFICGVFYLWGLTYLLLDLNLFAYGFNVSGSVGFSGVVYQVLEQVLLGLEALAWSVYYGGWLGVVWSLTTISILLHMMPSVPDIKGSWSGFWIMFIILFVGFAYIVFNFEGDYDHYVDSVYDFSLSLTAVLCQLLSILILLVVFSFIMKKTARLIAVLWFKVCK